jgi:HK97 family phage major capsid protein
MKTSKELREERASKYESLEALNAKRKAEKRNFTDEEVTQFETLETEIRTLNNDLKSVEAQERAEAITAARAAGAPINEFSEKDEKDLSKYSLRKALLSLSDPNRRLEGVELEMHQEGEKEKRESGVRHEGGLILPDVLMSRLFAKRAPLSPGVNGGSNLYGETVEGYVDALRPASVVLSSGAEYMSGMTSNFKISRESAVFVPTFKASQALATESTPSFSDAQFSPKRSTGFFDLDRQLLVQTSNSIEGRLRNQLILGDAQLMDRIAFTGDSADDEPVGIFNDADVPVLAIGANGGSITKALIETLVQRLEEAYGMNDNTKWFTSPVLKRLLKSLTLDAGSGQFVWDRISNSIDSIAAVSTTYVPKTLAKGTGTNLTAAILGDFRAATFAQWGGMEIVVDSMTQALKGNIRYIPIKWMDFHVVQPGSFQVIKDITTS